MKKSIGIIGGMGAAATCDLFNKIITMTHAASDQEQIHVLIDCNTNIPDRTKAILGKGKDPVPEMVRSGIRLQSMGADVLVMPCNTAHYFYDKITPFFDVPLLNMLKLTVEEIQNRGIKKVGLLATDGTIQSGVYHTVLAKAGIDIVVPSAIKQVNVMDIIYNGVKASKKNINLNGFYETMDDLFEQGAEILILGCTELPIAFKIFHIDRTAIDPTVVLAAAAIRFVNEPLKNENFQKAAMREMMKNYLKNINANIRDGADVKNIMRYMPMFLWMPFITMFVVMGIL
ncbi:cysteate racemase [Pectinatus haikarae]|uniref:Aspartate racemase n=1 Tax=Pectinatus haikarae TaxID=349096 RepID=A0ABT9Y8Z0_9FIRM|nr:amino acid racemase [Pectinatus haikarae]MDQ0203637.1 aspartate racemase [Pectinatus haikarae]